MKFVSSLKGIMVGFYRSIKRFPVTILLSIAAGVTFVAVSEMQPLNNVNLITTLNRIAMIFVLGTFLSLCIKLFFERTDGENILKLVIYYFAGALVLLLYYFFLLNELNMVSETRFIGVNLALILGFLFIPYFLKKEEYEIYVTKIVTGFFIAVLYSIVLFLGLSAILFTIDKLLSVLIEGKIYYYTWIFVAFAFAPSYFLAGLPLKGQNFTRDDYPKILRVLLLYIVMPLLTAYTVILYIYFVKIIVTWQWPVGLVSHLVLWYSVITAAVLFFITPIRSQSKWANTFLIWLPKIIIPILIMMFISMGIRIQAFGITESRYFVILLGLWAFGIMIYFSLVSKLRNIIIPVTLSIIAIISVFGPVSSYSISKYSQNSRFNGILARNNMLKDGQISTAPSGIPMGDKNEISRILDYFKYNHSLKDVKYLPENFKIEDMDRVFGFAYATPEYSTPGGYFFFSSDNSKTAVDIRGYDYLFDTRNLYNVTAGNEVDARYNPESSNISITYSGKKMFDKDLNLYVKDLVQKYGAVSKGNTIPSDEMIFMDENETVKVKIIFMNISASMDAQIQGIKVNGLDFYMLVKIK